MLLTNGMMLLRKRENDRAPAVMRDIEEGMTELEVDIKRVTRL